MEIQFCNYSHIESQIINLIHSLVFQTEKEKISALYNIFREVYAGAGYPIEDPAKVSLYYKDRSEISHLSNFALEETDQFIGVDFPTWFNFYLGKPKIMVVAIDPLRTDEDLRHRISIGTPFGIHHLQPAANANADKNLYWTLLKLLAKNYSVYVTDTFKVYFQENGDPARNSYKCRRFTNPVADKWQEEIHQKIFSKEVEIIEPDLIVTLGIHPVRWFSAEKKANFKQLKHMAAQKDYRLTYKGTPILPLMHLSGRVSNLAAALYGASSIKSLPSTYNKLVEAHLRRERKIST